MGSLLSCTECGLPGDVGGLVVHGRVEKQEFASFSFLSVALEMGKRKKHIGAEEKKNVRFQSKL